MTKLQMIKRTNDSRVFSINIPLDIIENLKWGKGDNLIIEKFPEGVIIKLDSKAEEVENGNN